MFDQMLELNVGQTFFYEPDNLAQARRQVTGASRYPRPLKGRRYSAETYNATSAASIERNILLLKITRVE